jgi:hypothetical protein
VHELNHSPTQERFIWYLLNHKLSSFSDSQHSCWGYPQQRLTSFHGCKEPKLLLIGSSKSGHLSGKQTTLVPLIVSLTSHNHGQDMSYSRTGPRVSLNPRSATSDLRRKGSALFPKFQSETCCLQPKPPAQGGFFLLLKNFDQNFLKKTLFSTMT